MKPYERNTLNKRRRNFNERLSRARKTVECAFGILYSKWRIISKAIETEVSINGTAMGRLGVGLAVEVFSVGSTLEVP